MYTQLNCLILGLVCSSLATAAENTEQVLAGYLEAVGGLEKINAVESVRKTGTMSITSERGGHGGHGGGFEAPVLVEYQPQQQRMRFEYEMQGKAVVQAYDGLNGWFTNPMMGSAEAEQMSQTELKRVINRADFWGALVNSRKKGHQVELLGTENVEGTQAFKLKITKADGDTQYYYLDKEHHLPFMLTGQITMNGQQHESTTIIGDYKQVDGLLIPHAITVNFAGNSQALSYSKIELNIDIDDSRFSMPAKPGG